MRSYMYIMLKSHCICELVKSVILLFFRKGQINSFTITAVE